MTEPVCASKACTEPCQRYSTGRYSVQCTEHGRAAKRKSRQNKADPMVRLVKAVNAAAQALDELKASA
jgi:hypothetical protein